MSKSISVILVDDHPMVLQGISACLEDAPELKLIGIANDVAELWTLPELEKCDVLVLDINLPEQSGIEAMPKALEMGTGMKVVVFSMHRGIEYARRALAAGASGYVFKDAMPEELIRAIETVHVGGTYLPPGIAVRLAASGPSAGKSARAMQLTDREIAVLDKVASGRSSKEIALMMGLSVRTVEAHRRNIKQKLDAKSASECVSIAMGLGLIS